MSSEKLVEHFERKHSFHFIMHLKIMILLQWLDLFATKDMIAKNGLAFEANELAKDLFVRSPELVDLIKIGIVPAIIFLVSAIAYSRFSKVGWEKNFITGMAVMNTYVGSAVLIVAYSDILKNIKI